MIIPASLGPYEDQLQWIYWEGLKLLKHIITNVVFLIAVTLVNTIIQISGVQNHNSVSVHCCVLSANSLLSIRHPVFDSLYTVRRPQLSPARSAPFCRLYPWLRFCPWSSTLFHVADTLKIYPCCRKRFSSSRPSNIPLYTHTTSSSSIHPSMGVYIASAAGLL